MRRRLSLFMLLAGCSSQGREAARAEVPSSAEPPPAPARSPEVGPGDGARDPGERSTGASADACPQVDEEKLRAPECNDALAGVPVPAIVDPGGALSHFHDRVVGLARGTVTDRVRIAVYGDSNMQADLMTGHMRRVLQGRFGDGGHGFVLLGRPKGWYMHQNVRRGGTWDAFRNIQVSNDLVKDRHYGFANVASETERFGAQAWVATAREGPVGTRAGRFEVFYFHRPGGGTFDVLADGAVAKTVATRADTFGAGAEEIVLDDGPHEIRCVSRGRGPVRLVGVSLERDVPGIVVDSLGTGAMNIGQMSFVQSSTRRPMLARRGYDLVVFHLGTTQSVLSHHKMWAKKVIEDVRAALPGASILVMTPPDYLLDRFGRVSDPRIVTVSRQLEEVARETGVAFWDYRAAMGGDASMRSFSSKGLVTRDWVHLTVKGHEVMGDRLMRALFTDLARWRTEHGSAGCGSGAGLRATP